VGVTESEVNTAGVTVRAADPPIVPTLAVIVLVPCATPVANPLLLTVATGVAEEIHLAVLVRFCVVPLLYVPVAVNCWVVPAAMEELAGVTAIETSRGVIPVPLSVAVCGLEVPLSTIVRVPVRAPTAAGVKDNEIKQLAPAARAAGLTGQLLVVAKSGTLVEMLPKVIAEPWPFFRATFLTGLLVP
jgi:hypothetical protein